MLQLKEKLKDASIFSQEVLEWIAQNNLWNIWVPKYFGGREMDFTEGLQQLQNLARMDGSLGWTVTLCSGANYFIGNLQPEMAREIFAEPAILGGSGGLFGTAEKVGNHYKLNGKWRYATGAPYLTHFTLNAKIVENGQEQKNEDGTPKFLSFVIPAKAVEVVEDWNTMGLKASATHSFMVNDVEVDQRHSFVYNQFHLAQPIFKIHFAVFADLTLWVNYIGMAEHLLAEAGNVEENQHGALQQTVQVANVKAYALAAQIEASIAQGEKLAETKIKEVHQTAADSVREMSQAIIALFPHLGVKASRENQVLNQIFRDFFTATQHHIFTK